MDIAYSREAMHGLLVLDAAGRERAVAAVEKLAAGDAGTRLDALRPVADGSDFRLSPYSPTGDLVIMRQDNTLVILALIDVVGALKGAREP